LLAYYIAREKKLNSFSIGFKEEGYDESGYAHAVAKKLGTKHFSEEFSVDDVIRIYDEIKGKLDEPLADASLIPTYKVCKLARKHVKVVLSGDGADELFGGYPTYQAQYFKKIIPDSSLGILENFLDVMPEALLSLLPTSFKDYPKKELAKIVLKGLSFENPERHLFWMRSFFLGNEKLPKKVNLKFLGKYIPDLGGVNNTPKAGQIIDFYTYLRDDFLVKVDRASMYNSLEVRVPYLDNDIIDFAFSVNKGHANLFKTKILMRELLRQKLPEVAKRPKKGFGIPLAKWLRSDLKDFAYSYIKNDKLRRVIPGKKIDRIWKDHQDMKTNNAGTIWMLTILSGWFNSWM
jgi:asparagine synthase (glutamine-hydrolysing)